MKRLTPGAAGILVMVGDAEKAGIDIHFEMLHKQIRKTMLRDWLIRVGEQISAPSSMYWARKVHLVEMTSKGREWYENFCNRARPPWFQGELKAAE